MTDFEAPKSTFGPQDGPDHRRTVPSTPEDRHGHLWAVADRSGLYPCPSSNEVTILSSLQPGCTCMRIKSYQYCNILYFINVVRLCQNFTQNVSFFGPEDENFA